MSILTRAAALGDIHTEDLLLEQSLVFIRQQVDTILGVGDIVDGFGDVNRCCDLLRTNGVHVVRGNHERWLLNDEMRMLNDASKYADIRPDLIVWLETLPATLSFETPDGALLLCHGLGTNDMAKLLPDDFVRWLDYSCRIARSQMKVNKIADPIPMTKISKV